MYFTLLIFVIFCRSYRNIKMFLTILNIKIVSIYFALSIVNEFHIIEFFKVLYAEHLL